MRLLLPRVSTSVNHRDNMGNTPLHTAVLKRQVECLQLLLTSPHLNVHQVNARQQTALQLALERHDDVCARYLGWAAPLPPLRPPPHRYSLEALYPQTHTRYHSQKMVSAVLAVPILTHTTDNVNDFIIDDIEVLHTQWTSILSDLVFDVDGREGKADMLHVLLQREEVCINTHADDDGNTPLMLAMFSRHRAAVELLLARPDLNIHARNFEGYTALTLHLARENDAIPADILQLVHQPRDTCWTTARHRYFPAVARQRIMATLLCFRRYRVQLPWELWCCILSFWQGADEFV